MPAARTYWVIVAGETPTSFRARHRETLLPTLRQLQRTQPSVVLRWFAGGRLWHSPEHADAAEAERERTRRERGPGWRPGGTHKDPRDKYKLTRDQKRARFKRQQFGKPGPPDAAGPDQRDRPDAGRDRRPKPADRHGKPFGGGDRRRFPKPAGGGKRTPGKPRFGQPPRRGRKPKP